jgi:hypothetical protein
MDEAENLRRQARRARQLAGSISDQQASEALILHGATLLDRAQGLEAQIMSPPQDDSTQPGPVQQQQQNAAKDEED